MDHQKDASSTTSLQSGIKKLFQIGHSMTALCCQIQEITNIFTEVVDPVLDPDPTEERSIKDLGIMDQMTTVELMELSNLENTRQALVRSWKYIESRKAGIIQKVKNRIADQGMAGQ